MNTIGYTDKSSKYRRWKVCVNTMVYKKSMETRNLVYFWMVTYIHVSKPLSKRGCNDHRDSRKQLRHEEDCAKHTLFNVELRPNIVCDPGPR